jgi:hypothetical protein
MGVLPLRSVKNCRREDSGWVNYFDKHALNWADGQAPEATIGGGQTVNTLVGFIYLFIYQLMHVSFIYLWTGSTLKVECRCIG